MFGALAPKVDKRDYSVCAGASEEFPAEYTVTYLPPVKNQGYVSSCVAHAAATILEHFLYVETEERKELSTNFIYGMQGIEFGRKQKGMYLRQACKILQKYGDPSEATIPGNIEQPGCTEILEEMLNDKVYDEAYYTHVSGYAKCNSEADMKHAIMNYGPLLISVPWYNNTKIQDGTMIVDQSGTPSYHALVICGWTMNGWLIQNSWGRQWGRNGFAIYPYKYKIAEAWSLVDADASDVRKPKRGKLLDIVYKIINFIINLFKKNA